MRACATPPRHPVYANYRRNGAGCVYQPTWALEPCPAPGAPASGHVDCQDSLAYAIEDASPEPLGFGKNVAGA
jgi:hypothetical protein